MCQLERRAERDQEEFESISRQLRKELLQFDRQRCRDFQSSIVVYLESLMNTQQQVRVIHHFSLMFSSFSSKLFLLFFPAFIFIVILTALTNWTV